MATEYTITVSDEVEEALQAAAAHDSITVQELVEQQLTYYIACALYRFMNPTRPFNTPNLSIQERIEAYAIYINDGEEAAQQYVDGVLSSR